MRVYSLRLTLLALTMSLLPAIATSQMVYQTIEDGITPKQREVYFYEMRAYPFGKIPQNARLDALQQARAKVPNFGAGSRSVQSIKEWHQIGPTTVGGRIRTIAVHPTDGKTVWAGAADGGVWKSTDNGANWRPVMDNENAIAMGALAVDPTNPNIVYAGTGEMSSNVDSYGGAGIFKSTDGGETWKVAGLTNVGGFSRIIVHPTNGNIIFAGGAKNNGGFYRSENGGQSWTRYSTIPVSDLTVNPANPDEIWVAAWNTGIFHSLDGGKTLTNSSSGIFSTSTTETVGRISVQVAPSNPAVLYTLMEKNPSSTSVTCQIFKSTNSGSSWTNVYDNTRSSTKYPNIFVQGAAPQGWYDQFLAVSPNNADKVIAGGISLSRTTDGGKTWSYTSGYSGVFHPDLHTLTFDPANPDRFYMGNDGGIWRSDNFGLNYTNVSDGLAVTQFYAMAVDQSDPVKTYGGTQDNGTVSSTGDGIGGGDGFYVCVDYSNPDIVYGETPNGALWKRDLTSGYLPINSAFDVSEDALWSAPIVMDPKDPQILYHGRRSLFVTVDGGADWTQLSNQFHGHVAAIGVSPVNTDVLYIGSERGELMVSTNGGQDWADRSYAPGLANRAITDFAPSLTDKATAYVALSGFYSGHIFKTTDYGATWSDVSVGLPDVPVNALAIHPDDPNIIYAGTDIGMFISVDGGATWANYNQGMPRVAVYDLEIHKANKTLRAATHGRSFWEIDLEKPALPPMVTAPAGGEVWMGGTPQVISWSGFSGPVNIDYSIDDGTQWIPLAVNVADNAFRWNVANKQTILARIRVTSGSETASSRTFTITPFEAGGVITETNTLVTPYGVAFDGQYLWATDFVTNKLVKLDPVTLKTVATVDADIPVEGDSTRCTDITYHPGKDHFFIHQLKSGGGGWLNEVTKTGVRVNRWPSPCQYPIGLAWMGAGASDLPYLLVTDRDAQQQLYLVDPDDGSVQLTLNRGKKVAIGPRGATSAGDGKHFFQVITDFSGPGQTLVGTTAEEFNLNLDPVVADSCIIQVQSPSTSGAVNARGIEIDPSDNNFFISDLSGNIFKIASCNGKPQVTPEPNSGVVMDAASTGAVLSQNLPNPFASMTSIEFSLPKAEKVALVVYGVNGELIRTIADRQFEAGTHNVTFDPAGLPSGVYRYTLRFNDGTGLSRTMVYVK